MTIPLSELETLAVGLVALVVAMALIALLAPWVALKAALRELLRSR